jgi:Dehydrogenases with different specificities (related to short-chain alcohol dehydrogenases)
MAGERLRGKTALITGGAGGIGRSIAEKFYYEGALVLVNYNSSIKAIGPMKDEMPDCEFFKADISNREHVNSMFKEVEKKAGALDILVNNAGVMDIMPLDQYDDNRVRKMFDINIFGSIYASLAAMDLLKKSSDPVVINLASNAGVETAADNTTYYAMTKAAIAMFTKRLAFDLRESHVRVNAIAPGWIKTDMTIGGKSEEEKLKLEELFRSRTSLSMTGEVKDIASAALFLATDDSRYMNGQILVIDGGVIDNLTHSL